MKMCQVPACMRASVFFAVGRFLFLCSVVGFIFVWQVHTQIKYLTKTITHSYAIPGERLRKDHEAQPEELSGRRERSLSPDSVNTVAPITFVSPIISKFAHKMLILICIKIKVCLTLLGTFNQ